ncbi:MAG: hypothetical protein QXX79_00340 [Candidatus Bathyarchaeia archaeon]
MKRKVAVITVELVDETSIENNDVIKKQLAKWFREDIICMPWFKKLKSIVVKEEQ